MINDPMSQMAQAQKLSIPQLQQALRDGTINPQVGQIVLASKIKQDKEAKTAMAAQMPKQPPVAQQNMMYGVTPGIDTMPTNLPVAGMAGGGIIAFDEGGHIPHFDGTDGSQVVDPYWEAQRLAEIERAPYVEKYQDVAYFPHRTLNKSANYLTSSVGDAFGNMRDKNTMVIDPETGRPISKYELKRKLSNATGKDAADQYRANGKLDAPTNQSFNLLSDTKSSSVNPNQVTANFMADANKPDTANPLAAGATRGDSETQGMTEAEIRAMYKDSGAPGGAGAGKGNPGIGGFQIKAPTFDDSYLQKALAGDKNPATGQPWTPEELRDKRRTEDTAAGVDRNIFKTQRGELDKKKEDLEKSSSLDEAMPWFALSERLGQAPKPGESAITSYSSALLNAAKVKGEITDKKEAKLDKIRTESNGLAIAQNQFAQVEASGDRQAIQAAQDKLDNHYKALSDFGIKKSEANALAEAESKKLAVQYAMNQNSVGATIYAADKAERNISQMAMQIQLDAAKAGTPITKSEAIKQAYANSNPGFGSIEQRDIASQRTLLSNQYKEIAKDVTLSTNDKAKQLKAIQAKIDALGSGGSPMAAIPNDISDIMSQYSKG
jgi:hypothetical protein